ncbi:MAG TPA: hypothetical protein DCE44_01640 [Verrucomicrobiales bacterium]|nr:hypothetical protein [Verrucomicrobiales bacterium]
MTALPLLVERTIPPQQAQSSLREESLAEFTATADQRFVAANSPDGNRDRGVRIGRLQRIWKAP